MKKRILAIIMACSLLVSFSGCKKSGGDENSDYNNSEVIASNDDVAAAPVSSDTDSSSDEQNSNSASSEKPNSSAPKPSNDKTVVKDVKMANKVNIKSSNTPMDKNLNFGGKTFTMAITEEPQYNTASFKRMIAAFSDKYNCKIQTKQLSFSTYNQQITQALSANKSYDIAFMHGSMFPSAPISNLYNDLTDYFTTADLVDSSKLSAGGIDLAKSSYFSWKNKLYGVCAFNDVYPYVIYYNKALFKANGLEDPMDLYNQGKWTWSKIKSMGKKVTNAEGGTYFLSSDFMTWGTLHSYGTAEISIKDGKVIENLNSPGIVKGLTLIKSLFQGSQKIAKQNDSSIGKYDTFLKGTVFMTMEESSKYTLIASEASSSIALQKSKDNIGIVPVPLDKTNTDKAYPTGWLTSVCSGKGRDPRVAVAFAKFRSSYNDPVKDANDMNDSQKQLVSKLISGNICFCHGSYSNTTDSTTLLCMNMASLVAEGNDISKTINDLLPKVQSCIKSTVG